MFDHIVDRMQDQALAFLRITIGILWAFHGAQKLFGWFDGPGLEGFSGFLGSMGLPAPFVLAAFVGGVEFFGGIAIAIGIFTRLAALLSASVAIVAYALVHGTQAWLPIVNRGELAVVYAIIFLYLFVKGAGKFSIDNFFCLKKDDKNKHVD